MRRLIAILLVALGLPAPDALPAPGPDPARVDRPNIVLVLADDLGYGDLGCYGQKRIRTPRLDRMASEGMRFTQFYAGATVCAPSRSALMQGLHTGHCRVRGNAGRHNPVAQALRDTDLTVATALRNAGYTTGLFGKWGLGDVGPAESGLPGRHGFDSFFGYLNQTHAHNYYPTFLWRDQQRVPLPNVVPNETPQGAGASSNKAVYSHDLITEEAFAFVRKNRERPFFLFLAVTLPHANNEAGTNGMEVPHLGPYEHQTDWPQPQRAHAAMIDRLDRDVGRLLDLIDDLGLRERTLFLFTSDNGPHREAGTNPEFNDSNGPLRGIKRDLYEGGIRVPFIARWPGRIPAGSVSPTVGWFPDFFPTALAIANRPAPDGLDGVSLLPVLHGSETLQRSQPLYWEFHEGGFKQAIRDGDWKLVRRDPSLAPELYDLQADPGETRDLAETHPAVVQRLTAQLTTLRVDSADWPVSPRPAAARPQTPNPSQ